MRGGLQNPCSRFDSSVPRWVIWAECLGERRFAGFGRCPQPHRDALNRIEPQPDSGADVEAKVGS